MLPQFLSSSWDNIPEKGLNRDDDRLSQACHHDDKDQDENTPEKGDDGEKDGGDQEEGEQVVVEEKQKDPANHCCQKTGG